jgi:hypothetical protein
MPPVPQGQAYIVRGVLLIGSALRTAKRGNPALQVSFARRLDFKHLAPKPPSNKGQYGPARERERPNTIIPDNGFVAITFPHLLEMPQYLSVTGVAPLICYPPFDIGAVLSRARGKRLHGIQRPVGLEETTVVFDAVPLSRIGKHAAFAIHQHRVSFQLLQNFPPISLNSSARSERRSPHSMQPSPTGQMIQRCQRRAR